jgi:hypothetical protein
MRETLFLVLGDRVKTMIAMDAENQEHRLRVPGAVLPCLSTQNQRSPFFLGVDEDTVSFDSHPHEGKRGMDPFSPVLQRWDASPSHQAVARCRGSATASSVAASRGVPRACHCQA